MIKHIFFILFFFFAAGLHAFSQIQKVEHSLSASEKLQHPPPVPYFSITGLCFGDTTHFINRTVATLISSQWNILNDKGDTLYHSEDKNIHFYFKKRGFYTVCLTANNGHIVTKARIIQVDTLTKAAFSFRSCYDEFDNQSSCSDQFIWILPDQSTSTAIDPAYAFTAPGKYAVTLISKKGSKADTLIKQITIKGDSVGIPTAAFTCKQLSADSTFEFTAVDGLADAYSWYFGDGVGNDTSGYKVIHKIKSAYVPPVNLFVTNGCGVSVDLLDPFSITDVREENKATFTVTVFPNPVVDEVMVSISKLVTGGYVNTCLIDGNGLQMKHAAFLSTTDNISFKYDVHALPRGIYILQVKAGEEVVNRKLIVK